MTNTAVITLILGITIIREACGAALETKIVGGNVVSNRSEFPYQVSLRYSAQNYHFCGGTIINESAILSAAHCFARTTARRIVAVVGDLNKQSSSDATVEVGIARIRSHPLYNSTTNRYDVAVLLTRSNFQWSSTVNYLPLASVTPEAGTNCSVSGWGSIAYGGTTSPDLKYAVVPTVSRNVCIINYGSSLITDDMICAGYMEGNTDSCNGDSGGPLACDGNVAGIVSWGYRCASYGFPGVYTNVAHLKSWIDEQVEDLIANYSGSSRQFPKFYVSFFLLFSTFI